MNSSKGQSVFADTKIGTVPGKRFGKPKTAPPGRAPTTARACCAYSEGKLYHMNAHGRVACLDAATGKELWAVNVLERFQGKNITWAMSECLLVDGPRLIVTPGGEKALMAALDKQNGQTSGRRSRSAATAWPCLAGPLPPCRAPRHSQLLVGSRFRRRCRHGQAALDRAAEEQLRHEHHHAGLRRRQDLLRDAVRLRNVLPIAARAWRAHRPKRFGPQPSTRVPARCYWSTACCWAAVTRSTSRGSAWIGRPGRSVRSSRA